MRPASLAIIMNDAAGSATTAIMAKIEEAFGQRGVQAQVLLAGSGEAIAELTQRALRTDADTIVAAGGDGTINAVASVILDSDRTLGVLPLGTLNHFAKDTNIPLELDQAIRALVEGTVIRIDVGEVNGRIFLNNSGLGLYPLLVRDREKRQSRFGHGKWYAFAWAALGILRRYPFLAVRLNTDTDEIVRRTPFVFIGNNEYTIDGANIGGRTRLDTGRLCIYTARRPGRLGLLRFAWRALMGRLKYESDFDALCTEALQIETKRNRLHVATDGEVTVMRTPLHYRIRPGALRLLVPTPPATT
jgi:diacylglycerol kinase family enzyme